MWKEHIDAEIIDIFLDRLFEHCGRSCFEFERVLKDYGMESKKVPFVFADSEIESLYSEIESLEERLKTTKSDNKRNHKLYIDTKAKLKDFKENSVVFSMDVNNEF